MSQGVNDFQGLVGGEFFVPGTSVATRGHRSRPAKVGARRVPRDPMLRNYYVRRALAEIPRLLGAVDRNPYRATYGCFDRQYWHYRTSSFPSQMYQEGVLPLALVSTTRLPGNRWYGNGRVRDLAVAGIRFAARSSHSDGSCDDYYPFERALGAAVFSLAATAHAYRQLELDDAELVGWFERRARWLVEHDESGHLANHQALAALGLLRVAQITSDRRFREAADARIDKLLNWQSNEGWFEEYGGADPGYQTLTIDCLAKYRQLTGQSRLDRPICRAVAFARLFLHPDDSYAGEYGSRGTYHFYPHGMELLAAGHPAATEAAELADGFLRSLARGTEAHFSDDRMFAHRLGNLIEAYVDWSPSGTGPADAPTNEPMRYLPQGQLLVRRTASAHTVVSAARGGVFKHFTRHRRPVSDAGLIVETTDGRVAVSQQHDRRRRVGFSTEAALDDRHQAACLFVAGPLHWSRFETVGVPTQTLLHAGMWLVGRWCRTLVRRILQRRLITGRRPCPIRLSRSFEFLPQREARGAPTLRVTDTIELTSQKVNVRRMSLGTDHQAAYVAASGVYQQSALAPWTDLGEYVAELNARRCVTVIREL